jgi:hypothetical protein
MLTEWGRHSSVIGKNVVSFIDFLEAYRSCLSVFFVDRSIRVIGKRCPFVRFADRLVVSVLVDV